MLGFLQQPPISVKHKSAHVRLSGIQNLQWFPSSGTPGLLPSQVVSYCPSPPSCIGLGLLMCHPISWEHLCPDPHFFGVFSSSLMPVFIHPQRRQRGPWRSVACEGGGAQHLPREGSRRNEQDPAAQKQACGMQPPGQHGGCVSWAVVSPAWLMAMDGHVLAIGEEQGCPTVSPSILLSCLSVVGVSEVSEEGSVSPVLRAHFPLQTGPASKRPCHWAHFLDVPHPRPPDMTAQVWPNSCFYPGKPLPGWEPQVSWVSWWSLAPTCRPECHMGTSAPSPGEKGWRGGTVCLGSASFGGWGLCSPWGWGRGKAYSRRGISDHVQPQARVRAHVSPVVFRILPEAPRRWRLLLWGSPHQQALENNCPMQQLADPPPEGLVGRGLGSEGQAPGVCVFGRSCDPTTWITSPPHLQVSGTPGMNE